MIFFVIQVPSFRVNVAKNTPVGKEERSIMVFPENIFSMIILPDGFEIFNIPFSITLESIVTRSNTGFGKIAMAVARLSSAMLSVWL